MMDRGIHFSRQDFDDEAWRWPKQIGCFGSALQGLKPGFTGACLLVN